jgi:hypothetical protein
VGAAAIAGVMVIAAIGGAGSCTTTEGLLRWLGGGAGFRAGAFTAGALDARRVAGRVDGAAMVGGAAAAGVARGAALPAITGALRAVGDRAGSGVGVLAAAGVRAARRLAGGGWRVAALADGVDGAGGRALEPVSCVKPGSKARVRSISWLSTTDASRRTSA